MEIRLKLQDQIVRAIELLLRNNGEERRGGKVGRGKEEKSHRLF